MESRPEILNVLLNEWAWLQQNARHEIWEDELDENEVEIFLSDAHLRIRQSSPVGLTDVGLYFFEIGYEDNSGCMFLNAHRTTQKDTLRSWLEGNVQEASAPVEYEAHRVRREYFEQQAELAARCQAAFDARVREVGHSQAHYEFYER